MAPCCTGFWFWDHSGFCRRPSVLRAGEWSSSREKFNGCFRGAERSNSKYQSDNRWNKFIVLLPSRLFLSGIADQHLWFTFVLTFGAFYLQTRVYQRDKSRAALSCQTVRTDTFSEAPTPGESCLYARLAPECERLSDVSLTETQRRSPALKDNNHFHLQQINQRNHIKFPSMCSWKHLWTLFYISPKSRKRETK